MPVMNICSERFDVPRETLERLARLTAKKVDKYFGSDIGLDAMGLRFHPGAMELRTSKQSGSVSMSINSFDDRMKDFTLDCLTQFTHREGASFIEATMPYGVRQFLFHPMPFMLPARISVNESNNHVYIEFILTAVPKDIKFYMVFGEIETIKCAKCGVHALKMHKCARCKCARYCSEECQKAHREQHKLICHRKKKE